MDSNKTAGTIGTTTVARVMLLGLQIRPVIGLSNIKYRNDYPAPLTKQEKIYIQTGPTTK